MPFDGLDLPINCLDIFSLTHGGISPRTTLLTIAAQLRLQYFLGSLRIVSNIFQQPSLLQILLSFLYNALKTPLSQFFLVKLLCLLL